MKLSFGPIILLLLNAVVTTTAEASIRGQSQEEQQQLDQVRHRLLLPADTECLLLRRESQLGNGRGNSVWCCEFTTEQATVIEAGLDTSTGIVSMISIDSDATNALIDAGGVISGTAIIRSSNLRVEQYSATGVMSLVVPEDVKLYALQKLPEDDSRHYKARRARALALQSGRDSGHRDLAPSTGTLETLVVRVIANNGVQPPSEMQLYDDIFDDSSSLKSQYGGCSKGQLNIIPTERYGSSTAGTTGGGNSERTGIVTVKVDVDSFDRLSIEPFALAAAEAAVDGPLSNFGLVIFCHPEGSTEDFIGYAYVNDYRSFYNDFWCSNMSALVHEVGHNLGLDHSGVDTKGVTDPDEPWREIYGDLSGT
jgi:hypothetical protein